MPVDVNVPSLGESISEVQVSAWLKQPGEAVTVDEPLIELESDKATVEVPAPVAGVVLEIVAEVGSVLKVGDVLARIEAGAAPEIQGSTPESAKEPEESMAPVQGAQDVPAENVGAGDARAKVLPQRNALEGSREPSGEEGAQAREGWVMPAAQRALAERGMSRDQVVGTGPGGRVLKEDVARAPIPPESETAASMAQQEAGRSKRAVPMSPIRRRIAERLVQAQQNAALLTTFNEIDMSRAKALRAEHQEAFTSRYGVKLGYMSFFVKAAVQALHLVPEINAKIQGSDTIFYDYCDIGIAVGGGKGLVVPAIRNAERLGFGEVEQIIADFGRRAQTNEIRLDELEGGTFTISNGGVYGSLLSTPIVNPPQSGVLGLHAIQDRPIVIDGQVVVRPMMYVALTYDHRIVDGREAVRFLKHIKQCVEQPERLLLKV